MDRAETFSKVVIDVDTVEVDNIVEGRNSEINIHKQQSL